MNGLTTRQFETKFDDAINLFNWIYAGKNLQLESANDPLTKELLKVQMELL